MFLKSFLSALHRGNHTYYVLGWTVLTGLFSHRAPSSSCRLLPACPEEVRCCHSCSSEPRPDVGGDSGESRQRAVGFGSSPPGCLRSASEVKPSPHLQSFNMKMYCFALSSCRQRSVVVIKLLSTDVQAQCSWTSLYFLELKKRGVDKQDTFYWDNVRSWCSLSYFLPSTTKYPVTKNLCLCEAESVWMC